MSDRELERKLLLDIHAALPVISERLGAIEADLAYHIKRTELLETEVKYLHKQINIAHGAIALLTFGLGAYKVFF